MVNEEVNSKCPDYGEKKERLRQRFQVIKKLGQGTYGKVQLAVNRETKQEVAIKTIRKAKIENEQDMLRIRREIQIMASIQHPHIIHIYEVFENCEKIVLVMQYASGGELYDYLGSREKLPEKESRRIFRQIAAAIYHCHKNKICHRDLKLENILLDDKGNAKIADFGLSNIFDESKKLHTFCGSPLYASPEIVKGTPYCGPEVDCWSMGVLLYTLVYGAMPFDGSNFKRLVKQISTGDYNEPEIKSSASGIIRRLLTVDASVRANINDICTNNWVNDSYDHSLLKVASDMSSLAPASTPYLPPALHISNESTYTNQNNFCKNAQLLHKTTATFQHNLDSLINRDENNETSDKSKLEATDKSCDSHLKFHAIPLKNSNMPLLIDNITKCLNRPYSSCSNKAKNPPESSTVNGNTNYNPEKVAQQRYFEHDKNKDMDQNSSVFRNKSTRLNNFNQCSSENNDINIESFVDETTTEKNTNCVNHLNKPKSCELDSIVPIFEVTSVIPKRQHKDNQRNEVEKPSSNLSKNYSEQKNSKKNSSLERKTCTIPNETLLTTNEDINVNGQPEFFSTDNSFVDTSINNKNHRKTAFYIKHDAGVISSNQFVSEEETSSEIVEEMPLRNKNNIDGDEITAFASSETKYHFSSPFCDKPEINLDTLSNSIGKVSDINQTCITSTNKSVSESPEKELPTSESLHKNVEPTPIVTTDSISSQTHQLESNIQFCNQVEKVADNFKVELQNMIKNGDIDCDTNISDVKENATTDFTDMCETLQCNKTLTTSPIFGSMGTSISVFNSNNSDNVGRQASPDYCSNASPEFPTYKNSDFLKEVTNYSNQKVGNRKLGNESHQKLKNRSYSLDEDERLDDLTKILRRRRKYSLCAFLAASFENDQLASGGMKKDFDRNRKLPGKVTIPRTFDPSSESENSTVEKKEFILIPSISVAENKQKLEKKIEKVKLSALSMKPRRKSELNTRRKLKKFSRSHTNLLQSISNLNDKCILQINPMLLNEMHASNVLCLTEENNCSCRNLINENYDICCEELCLSCTEQQEIFSQLFDDALQRPRTHVPITRCCKKITFPPELSENKKVVGGFQEVFDKHQYMYLSQCQGGRQNQQNGGLSFIENEHDTIAHREHRHNYCNKNKISQNDSDFQSYESLNNISTEKDSSDNDDELDALMFNSNLEEYESKDFWKFLKLMNGDRSNQFKKRRKNSTKLKYFRSKSQECGKVSNAIKKLLMRSRSKDDKSNQHLLDYSCTFQTSETKFGSIPKQHAISYTNVNEIFPKREIAKGFERFSIEDRRKKRYFSSKSFDDIHTISKACDLGLTYNEAEKNVLKNVLNIGDSCQGENANRFSCMSSPSLILSNMYKTENVNEMCKTKRSQSFVALSTQYNFNNFNTKSETSSQIDTLCSDKKHSIDKRSKAMSDLGINLINSHCENNFSATLSSSSVNNLNSIFSKSLESTLEFERRIMSPEDHTKHLSFLNKKTDRTHKKRTRKVSFVSDITKDEHATFVMESIAKAQKALTNIERVPTDFETPHDQGTLLEALKTHGYKFIMSQRLQHSPDKGTHSFSRRVPLCYFTNQNSYKNDDYSLPFLHESEYVVNDTEYPRNFMRSRSFLHSLVENYKDYTEVEHNDLNDTCDRVHIQPNINWCKMPNMWLYQNVDDFKSTSPSMFESSCSANDLDLDFLQKQRSELSFLKKTSGNDWNSFTMDNKANVDRKKDFVSKTTLTNALESPIEKLSLKIKALKNRCQKKYSFNDISLKKNESFDSLEKQAFEKDKTVDTDNSATNEVSEANKAAESVTDRIWRKSFYTRFNDTVPQRRRKSSLFESEYPQDLLLMKPSSSHFRNDNAGVKEVKCSVPRKESATNCNTSNSYTPTYQKSSSISSLSTSASEQNIPNHDELM